MSWEDLYRRMRNVAAGYSNIGDVENGTSRRLDKEFEAIEKEARELAQKPTMADAIAAGDGTLHGAIDYWQQRALKAEAVPKPRVVAGTNDPYAAPLWATPPKADDLPDDYEVN